MTSSMIVQKQTLVSRVVGGVVTWEEQLALYVCLGLDVMCLHAACVYVCMYGCMQYTSVILYIYAHARTYMISNKLT